MDLEQVTAIQYKDISVAWYDYPPFGHLTVIPFCCIVQQYLVSGSYTVVIIILFGDYHARNTQSA